jgi:glycerate-2-kinase
VSGAPERRAQLEAIFREALAAVDAAACTRGALAGAAGAGLAVAGRALPPGARVFLLAAGKAAAPMARVFEERAGAQLAGGLAVTKDGHGLALAKLRLREAAHPLPDARSERAGREALALAAATRREDVLCVLLSGGASSLLACPAEGLTLSDLRDTTQCLLDAGADIHELNTVRKHLSALAGGRLARAAGAGRIEVLALSDVPGDRADVIASGPCAADPSTYAEALSVLARRGVQGRVPARVRALLEAGARGELAETPKPGDPALARVRTTILASNASAVAAAREAAARRGLRAVVVSQPLSGEARDEGRRLARLARALSTAQPPAQPTCLVAGGETTVRVRGKGRGGRNQELALAAALALAGGAPAALLAAGTDGSDGPTEAAGAYADEGTAARGRRAGVDPEAALAENDSHSFFLAEGGLFVTGPTGTNVMDLALLRVEASAALNSPVSRASKSV